MVKGLARETTYILQINNLFVFQGYSEILVFSLEFSRIFSLVVTVLVVVLCCFLTSVSFGVFFCFFKIYTSKSLVTLRLLLLAGTNFSVLVVCCIWQVLILAFFLK